MNANDIIRQRLLEALGRRGMTQAELARQMGLPPASVGDWTTGRHGMMTHSLRRVCVALGVSADWMLGLKGDEE